MKYCDFHIHTIFSDGLLKPEEVVAKAKEQELSVIAIADHDAVDGVEPAIRTGKELGIEVIPSVELSSIYDNIDIHILGYFIDYKNPELLVFLKKVQVQRTLRAKRIIEKLKEQGVELSVERVLELAGTGSVGRPHIAQALFERGYINSFDEAFYRFIGYHSPAYVPKMEISPGEAIELINHFSGISVVAHPGTMRRDDVIYHLIEEGISGIEVWHPEHNEAQVEYYLELAIKNRLLITGGSDCHGGRKGKLFLGEIRVPYEYYEELKSRHEKILRKADCGKRNAE